ncbi:MAG: glycosyltransferase [Thermodesulfobacteriota bacterium]
MKKPHKGRYNILYTTSFGNMMGGGQWSLYCLVKHLNKDIFYPIVLCPGEGELTEMMRAAGAGIICLDVGRLRYLNMFTVCKLISFLKERNIALVHSDSTTETFYTGIAARILGIPLIWHIRASEGGWFLDRVLSLFATRVILVAKAISSRFRWLKDKPKMTVIYNGIDLKEFDAPLAAQSVREEFDIDSKTLLIGCIGRVEERKGQEYLLRALKDVDAALILVGEEDKVYRDRLDRLGSEIGITDRVIYTGYRKDVVRIMKEIDIAVFPTLTEAFSRVILEAMAAERPVIATDVGGNPEAVMDGVSGYIVPVKYPAALADKINELAVNRRKRREMGMAGRRRVEGSFDLQQNANRNQELYLDILEKRR